VWQNLTKRTLREAGQALHGDSHRGPNPQKKGLGKKSPKREVKFPRLKGKRKGGGISKRVKKKNQGWLQGPRHACYTGGGAAIRATEGLLYTGVGERMVQASAAHRAWGSGERFFKKFKGTRTRTTKKALEKKKGTRMGNGGPKVRSLTKSKHALEKTRDEKGGLEWGENKRGECGGGTAA